MSDRIARKILGWSVIPQAGIALTLLMLGDIWSGFCFAISEICTVYIVTNNSIWED